MIGGLLIILANITNIPGVLVSIIRGAFGLDAVAGGAIGSMIIAMQRGVARGLYSNEAGEGSAPVIHSAANVNHPAEQGMTGVIEVFLDTFVICTITGLVLGVTGILDSGAPANVIVTYAFDISATSGVSINAHCTRTGSAPCRNLTISSKLITVLKQLGITD